MASMSVKNRVAMFEHAGGNDDDRSSPGARSLGSFKRPGAPTNQPFKKPTTPVGTSFKRPTTPSGPSFLKPTTPNTPSNHLSFNRPSTPNRKPLSTNVANGATKTNRNSWPWPPEESVIPVPNGDQTSDNARRYSSPFLPQANAPVILPQKSPVGRKSLGGSPGVLSQQASPDGNSPLKHIQNKETPKASSSPSFSQGKPDIMSQFLQNRQVIPASTKPLSQGPGSLSSLTAALSKSGSLDENRAPRVSDVATQRSKALQLARSRISHAVSTSKSPAITTKEEVETKSTGQDERSNDDSSTSSSRSSHTNNELLSINRQIISRAISPAPSRSSLSSIPGHPKPSDSTSIGEESRSIVSTSGEKQHIQANSRAGKLSQAIRRTGTPEPAPEVLEAGVQRSRSLSPMQAVRGARTISKVSHHEARKALLQAAQRKKEKADAVKQLEEQQAVNPQPEENTLPDENTSKVQRSSNDVSDRLALRAANVLAIKNSSKLLFANVPTVKTDELYPVHESMKDTEGSTSGSIVSLSSADKRRINHPAFMARSPRAPIQIDRSLQSMFAEKSSAKPQVKTDNSAKPFSEELFSSFRHFKESRPEMLSTENQAVGRHEETTNPQQSQENVDATKVPQGRPPHPLATASPLSLRSPRNLREAVAGGSGSVFNSFEYSNASPMNIDGKSGRLSIDSVESPFMEQEESLHSTSDRNFDRRYADGFYAIGQPKYAAPRQMFPQQEGGYLSSLSSATFSQQSMISLPTEHSQQIYLRLGPDGVNPLGEMSPGPSMRSGHSMAHSIVSMSPRVDVPRGNNEFEYLLNSPSKHSAFEAGSGARVMPTGVPPQIDEEEGSEPTVGPSVEGQSEPTIGSSIEQKNSKEDLAEFENNSKENTVIPIQTSYSAAEAPPGFVFHDDESEGSGENSGKKHDPVGMSFDRQCVADDHESEGIKVNQRDGERALVGKDDSGKPGERSTSTKGTTSSSLRSGLSSIQNGSSNHARAKDHAGEDINVGNGSQREGSYSIRTGLSGLQNSSDLDGSASMRSVSVSMKSTTLVGNEEGEAAPAASNQFPVDPPQLKIPPVSQAPPKRQQFDTIVEDEEEESSGMKPETYQQPVAPRPDPPRDFGSTIGPQPTASTDTSSGPHSDPQNDKDSGRGKQMLPASLAINTRTDRKEEDISISDSPASSRHSRWKMKMPNVIKSVLAKASTPRGGQPISARGEVNEKTGFSTSEDEEDDIFGGLEDDVSKVLGPKKPSSTLSAKDKIVAKHSNKQPPTPNKFFHSGHTRRSEPPRALESKDVPTPSRRSVRSDTRAINKPISRRKTPENKLSLKGFKKRLTSPMANSNPYSMYSTNDRSGTVVEQEMEHVNSDITSSILGAPFQKFGRRPRTPTKGIANQTEEDKAHAKTPKAKTIKNNASQSVSADSKSKLTSGKDTLLDGDNETKIETETVLPPEEPKAEEEKKEEEEPPSMFMNFTCGLTDAFTAVANVCRFGAKDEEPEETKVVIPPEAEDDEGGTFISADSHNTSSHLTELEKRVWNEWDKLDSAFNKAAKPLVEKKEEHDKKREVARGKLLEIANSAVSSQVSKGGDNSGASASYTTGSSSDSAETGESSGASGSSSEAHSSAESRSYLSGSAGSDLVSAEASKATTTPILLSFSQRSLIEKFSKQLANVGVEVLKLNRRKQWQVRYFTVSKEQIALIAHEANSKSGAEVAQCPKALLWLKKFNAKGGGYSLANIDKNGHGGMLLVDLKDIHVSNTQDIESPIPKKIADKFKDSVLVTLDYLFKSEKRHIEFRCKDNDEAQFLCTCMRVIRDLLKREQALRVKTQQAKGASTKKPVK